MIDFERNVQELERRGYVKSYNRFFDEDQWIKGDVIVTFRTVSDYSFSYFLALLNQKEVFKFEIIDVHDTE